MSSAAHPPTPPTPWLSPANVLTGTRLVAAPACAAAIAGGWAPIAAWLFALAIATDLADGRVARRFGQTSARGALLDHATDATFVTLGLAAVAFRSGEVPWLLPLLVVCAFAQYVADSSAHVGRHLRASSLGRWNGIAYFAALGVPVVRDGLGFGWPSRFMVSGFAWLLVASTLLSIVDRWSAVRKGARA